MWKYIKKSSRNFPKHPASLSATPGPSCFSGCMAVLMLRAHVSSPHHSLCYWLLGPHAGARPGRGSRGWGVNPTQGHANPPPWPRAHALMARVSLGLAELPGGKWAWVSGGQPWGHSGVTREVAQVMSGSVASQDLQWPGQQEKLLQSLSGEMQEAELGTSFLPTAQHPHHPSWQLGAGPLVGDWQGVGWLLNPCAVRPGVWQWRQPRRLFLD